MVGKTKEQIDRRKRLLERSEDIETSELVNLMEKINELISLLEGLGFEKVFTMMRNFSSDLAYIIIHRD